jgi:aryl-alcohol dehydrogenase-like predicted oxidoreductase
MFVRQKMEKEYLPLFKSPYGMGTTIWSPLSSGVLTGKYNKGIPEGSRLAHKNYADMLKKKLDDVPKVIELEEIAKSLGCSVGNLAIAWCVKNQDVSTVILGASDVEQLKDNLKALDVVPKLTSEVLEKIEAILKNKPEQEPTFGRER